MILLVHSSEYSGIKTVLLYFTTVANTPIQFWVQSALCALTSEQLRREVCGQGSDQEPGTFLSPGVLRAAARGLLQAEGCAAVGNVDAGLGSGASGDTR